MTRMTRTAPAERRATPALPSRLRMVVTRLARRLRQQGESAASPTQLAALATIERDGPLTLGALATIERVRPRTDRRDRRVAHVEITAPGRRLLAESRSRKTAYLERRLAALSAGERQTLEQAAEILERVLQEELP